ncbi:hypothetical protein [Bradyrhizobium sp. USDA 3256]
MKTSAARDDSNCAPRFLQVLDTDHPAMGGLTGELNFAHGLYVTLKCRHRLDEEAARKAVSKMSADLGQTGFPIRHAGSFGFDFAAAEWFHDAATGEFSVRISVPDLPTALWDEQTCAIARWWDDYNNSRSW